MDQINERFASIYAGYTIDDLKGHEAGVQDLVLQYDSVILNNPAPLVLSRCCGKILKVSESLAYLLEIPVADLVGYLYLYELFTGETAANFFETTLDIMLSPQPKSTKSVITKCVLVRRGILYENCLKNSLAIPKHRLIPSTMSLRLHTDDRGLPFLMAVSFVPMMQIK